MWNRTTKFQDGREIQWDVVGHDTALPTFVTVFTFDTTSVSFHFKKEKILWPMTLILYLIKQKTTCILKEYAQGTNEVVKKKYSPF